MSGVAHRLTLRGWRPIVILRLTIGFCFVVTGSGCREQTPPAVEAAKEPAPLEAAVMTVAMQTWPTVVRTQGSLIADEMTTVGAKVAGRVVSVCVDLGDQVAAGDAMVTLDRDELRLALAQAEAQLSQARAAVGLKPDDDVASLDPLNAPPAREAKAIWDEAIQRVSRLRQLHEQNTVSSTELEQGEAAERVAEARYASALNGVREKIALINVHAAEVGLAQQRLDDAVTPAPFDAFVRSRMVAPGTYVQVGQALVELVRTSTLRFRGAIPERYAQSLRIGQDVTLKIESLDQPRMAKVTRVSPSLDELSRSLVFEAEIANEDSVLRSGLFAEASVILNPNAQSLVVPSSAVVRFAGVEKVWKVTTAGQAEEVVVRLGRGDAERVEVVSGLSVGDTILMDGSLGRVAHVVPASAKPPHNSTSSSH
ncbi:MAG: efflux RND transporter periplasmic adaptor subunit [Planctomycetales bacterium]|nr:efflux RND transporter periplasmic adaptor subunit [Planctomycetales bacterium]